MNNLPADYSHEMSRLIFYETNIRMSSATNNLLGALRVKQYFIYSFSHIHRINTETFKAVTKGQQKLQQDCII